jgi:GNAT superfamily N-acetyltransferase
MSGADADTSDLRGVTVREAVPADVARMIELLAFGALEEGKEDPSDPGPYRAALDDIHATGGHVLVADRDGDVVGMCQVVVFRHFQSRGGLCAELESVHVHPDLRSRGIGAQLVGAAVEVARRAGCYRIQLTSNSRRRDAHRFYQRLGFEPTHVGFKRMLGPP